MLLDPRREIKHKAGQILHDAARYIEVHGWCQGAMEYNNRVCIFGAIRAVDRCYYDEVQAEIVWRLRQTIIKKFGSIGPNDGAIAGWNDMPGRTKEQVIEVLDKAANA